MKNSFNKYFIAIISMLLVFSVMSNVSAASDKLEDGEYEARVLAIHTNKQQLSSTNDSLKDVPAKLKVTGNDVIVTVFMEEDEGGNRQGFHIVNEDGSLVEVVENPANTYTFTIKNQLSDEEIKVNLTERQGGQSIIVGEETLKAPNLIQLMQATIDTKGPMGIMTPNFLFGFDNIQLISQDDQGSQDEDTEKSGKYSIEVDAYRTGTDTPSMMAGSLVQAVWEFIDGKIYAYVTFENPLTDASFKNSDGDFVPFLDVINETTYKFEIFDVNERATIETHIAANNNMRVDFDLAFDQSTLTKLPDNYVFPKPVQPETEPKKPENNTNPDEKQPENNTNPDQKQSESKETNTSNQTEKVANPKTGDAFTMFYIAIAFMLLAGATYSLRLRKN